MTAPPSATAGKAIKHSTSLFLALIVAGLAGNYFNYPIFHNIDFLFGGIFAMLALQLFGLGRGVLAAAIIAAYTYFLWNHPYSIIIMIAEVATVGWLMRRHRIGLVLADTLFWLLIGMPLVYLFYHFAMQIPLGNVYIVMIKQAVNGIANALVARLIFTGLTLCSLRSRRTHMSYREAVYNLLAFFVLCPALIMLAAGSRTDFSETDHRIRTLLVRDSESLSLRLGTWVINRKSSILNLAELAASKSPLQMQSRLEQAKKSDLSFRRIALIDSEAISVAAFPLADRRGQTNIGRNYTDRPFIPTLKQSLKPMLSEVVMSKIDKDKPVVAMLAPVVVQGKYTGFVAGILSMDQIQEQLNKSTHANAMLYTLIDKNHNVIMTNRSDQKVMTPFRRGDGKLIILGKGISQWVSAAQANTPFSERWQKSYYIAESGIGDLAEWRLILEQPVAPYQKLLYDNYSGKLTQLFFILLVALALAVFLSRRFIATLEKLRLITHDLPVRLATDDKEIAWPESSMKETNHLIKNFREMAESLSSQFHEIRQINESLEQRVEARTRELQESELNYRTLADFGQALVWTSGTDRLYNYFNKVWLDFTGRTYEKEFGNGWTEGIHPEDYQRCVGTYNAAFDKREAFSRDYRLRRHDGEYRWIQDDGCPRYDTDSNFVGYIGYCLDITERKKFEEALRKSELLYHSLVETSQDLIWQCDAEGSYTFLNLAWEGVLGYKLDEMLGKAFTDFQTPESAERAVAEYRRLMNGHSVNGFETTLIGKNGNLIHLVFNAAFMRDEQGNVIGSSGTAYDISERKRAEDELRRAKADAEAANTAKSQFLANMSHEIRTPMNGVIGLTELLLGTKLTGEQREYAELVKLSGKNLVQLISDILDLSKIEAHKIELEMRNFDLRAETAVTINLLALRAQEKGLELGFQIDPDVPAFLKGDAGRLRQIINNLIGNAIKFTSRGSISLQVHTEADNDRYATLRFLVNDSGIGIAANKLETIFKPFTQADGSTTRKFGGTGLGLTISRQLAELMGGTVGVESVEDEGSTFWFTAVLEKQDVSSIEINEPKARNPEDVEAASGSGIRTSAVRLLLVEDDPTNQRVTQSILVKCGYQVDVACNGLDGVKLLEQNDYELVLMDCVMPVMNGSEATAVIRDEGSAVRNHKIPVIALTANAMQEDRSSCLAAGMDDYLSKPLEVGMLLTLLEKWVPSGSARGVAVQAAPQCEQDTGRSYAAFGLDEFVRRNCDDLDLSRDVAAIFIDHHLEYTGAISSAAAACDAGALRQAAHKLKGAAVNLALPLLAETAAAIESAATAGDFEKAMEMLPQLETRFDQAVDAIRELLVIPNE